MTEYSGETRGLWAMMRGKDRTALEAMLPLF